MLGFGADDGDDTALCRMLPAIWVTLIKSTVNESCHTWDNTCHT